MTLFTKINMKDLLSQGLYYLMLEKSFDKITIKQICEKTGVIRGTFYHHFIDKYEALEYLTHEMIFEDKNPQQFENEYTHVLKHLLQIIYEKKTFFHQAFQVQGQNGFEEMLKNIFIEYFYMAFDQQHIEFHDALLTREFLAAYQANALLFILSNWLKQECVHDELYAMCCTLFTTSLYDILIQTETKSS